jgi:hypothetical protein
MNQGKYVFSQIMEFVSHYDFNQCVNRYRGHKYVKTFTCREQFLAMVFGQLGYRESLRDIVTCLDAHRDKLYHFGFRSLVAKTTLARANEQRDWRIYRDLAQALIIKARKLYVDDAAFNLDLDGAVYVLDASIIELCLTVFQWAEYIPIKSAVKFHLLMDLKGNIPTFFHISEGRVGDIKFLDMLEYEAGAYYVMDRGYIDYKRLYRIHKAGAFFVTRAKVDTAWKRLYSRKVDKSTGLCCDQTIRFTRRQGTKDYPDTLRRIKYFDADTNQYYVFLTNNFNVDALTIATLYKNRWQVELFFKWIKQHLKIKTFWGHSENAVKTQICIALCVYLIVAIIKKQLTIERNIYQILQIFSISLLDKTPISQLISDFPLQTLNNNHQLPLF